MLDIGNAFETKWPGKNNLVYIYRLLYQNLMVTTNQKSTIDTHTQKKK